MQCLSFITCLTRFSTDLLCSVNKKCIEKRDIVFMTFWWSAGLTKNANKVNHGFNHGPSINPRMQVLFRPTNLQTCQSKHSLPTSSHSFSGRSLWTNQTYLCQEVAVASSPICDGRSSTQPATVRDHDVIYIWEESVFLGQDHGLQPIWAGLLHALDDKLHINWQLLVNRKNPIRIISCYNGESPYWKQDPSFWNFFQPLYWRNVCTAVPLPQDFLRLTKLSFW